MANPYTGIRRHGSGSIDIGHYVARGRRLRSIAAHRGIRRVFMYLRVKFGFGGSREGELRAHAVGAATGRTSQSARPGHCPRAA